MFMTSYPALFSLVVLSCLSLSHVAADTTPPVHPTSAVPECAANCMSIKITEAATWFGASDVQTYCQHPEFLEAYNICLKDHCKGDDLIAGKQAGEKTCAGVTPNPGGAASNSSNPKNTTAHPPLSGPAGTPDNTTSRNDTNTLHGATTNGTPSLSGALPPISNSTGTNAVNSTSRFSGATGSAAANASSQAGAASSVISSSSAIMFTTFSSCLLSLII